MTVLNEQPAGPADRWDIGGIVTLAMMPDRWDILGDPGPVRVSPSLRPIGRIPQPAVGCSSRGLQTCAWGAARATGIESNGEVVSGRLIAAPRNGVMADAGGRFSRARRPPADDHPR
jgi:hypothetical protein